MGTKCPKCDTVNPSDSKYCKECATSLPSSKEIPVTKTLEKPTDKLTRGTTFASRYEIIEELGMGGMGRVYRVKDQKLDEEMALKVLKPEIAADKGMIERFKNELKLARKIAHKSICKMYDLNEEEETPYITMEYVKGEDLKSFIRRKEKLSEEETIAIAKQVCEGLKEAHELGVIHRDLKPQNIMIDEKNNAKVMDFGIARSVEAPGITHTGMMIGTPDYISPEQAEGEEADQRSDIYALGVILYEMVTGRVPFKGDTAFSVALKHKAQLPKEPRKLNPEISESLNRLILVCMEKEKERRYQRAEELLDDLRNTEEGFPLGTKIQPRRATFVAALIRKKLYIPALVAVALVIIAVVIRQPWQQNKSIPIPSDKPSLAVVYFENVSGDENLDHWRTGFTELLSTDLMQSKFVNVLSGDRVYSILKKLNFLDIKKYSTEDLIKIANEGRASHTISGSFIKAGDNILITVLLQKPHTGEIINSQKAECSGEEEILQKIDELTRQIKLDLNLTQKQIASDIDKEVGKITTSYPEALKYYSEGRKYHLDGDYRQSIPFMERAIEIDPEFALAYRSLGMAHSNLGNTAERKKYFTRAFELSDRVSDKERYWIQGGYYIGEKKYDKAIEAYNKLFKLDPSSPAGRNNCSSIYRNLEEWDKAIEHSEVARKNKSEFIGTYTNLGYCYAAKGMYQKAREALQDYINNYSDVALIHEHLAESYACEGKYDLALEESNRAIAIDPSNPMTYRKGSIYQLMGRYEDAEKEYIKLLENENITWHLETRGWLETLNRTQGKFEKAMVQAQLGLELSEKFDRVGWKLTFHFRLGYNYYIKGDLEKASQEFSKMWDVAVKNDLTGNQHGALYWKGRTLLEMKSMNETLKAADELKQLIEGSIYPKNIRLYHNLMGRVELEKKNYSKAIDYFKKAYSEMPAQYNWYQDHALLIYPLGFAYFESEDLDQAQEEYERILAMTTGRLSWGDLYAKSFYMLGKIYEQQGNKAKAIEHYEKFLNLKKEADPGIVEVEDAKKRLAGLKSN